MPKRSTETQRQGRGAASARRVEAREWICHVTPGCESLATAEVAERLDIRAHSEGGGEIRFAREEAPAWERLRLAELGFLRLLSLPSPDERRAGPAEMLAAFASRAVGRLHETAALVEAAKLGPVRTVRIVTRMTARYPFPRQHLRDQAEARIAGMIGQRFRTVEESGAYELWITAGPRLLTVDLRLTPESQRHRLRESPHREGGLRPAVAAALVRASRPLEGELFCDPFCGIGTIGFERSHYGLPYSGLLLGDRDSFAVSSTAMNFGRFHEPRRICRWDARRLPLADDSIDSIVTNPPFGVKSRARDLPILYRDAFAEMGRVLSPAGRALVLVGDVGMARDCLARAGGLREIRSLPLVLQGRDAVALFLIPDPTLLPTEAVTPPVTSRGRSGRRPPPAHPRSSRGR